MFNEDTGEQGTSLVVAIAQFLAFIVVLGGIALMIYHESPQDALLYVRVEADGILQTLGIGITIEHLTGIALLIVGAFIAIRVLIFLLRLTSLPSGRSISVRGVGVNYSGTKPPRLDVDIPDLEPVGNPPPAHDAAYKEEAPLPIFFDDRSEVSPTATSPSLSPVDHYAPSSQHPADLPPVRGVFDDRLIGDQVYTSTSQPEKDDDLSWLGNGTPPAASEPPPIFGEAPAPLPVTPVDFRSPPPSPDAAGERSHAPVGPVVEPETVPPIPPSRTEDLRNDQLHVETITTLPKVFGRMPEANGLGIWVATQVASTLRGMGLSEAQISEFAESGNQVTVTVRGGVHELASVLKQPELFGGRGRLPVPKITAGGHDVTLQFQKLRSEMTALDQHNIDDSLALVAPIGYGHKRERRWINLAVMANTLIAGDENSPISDVLRSLVSMLARANPQIVRLVFLDPAPYADGARPFDDFRNLPHVLWQNSSPDEVLNELRSLILRRVRRFANAAGGNVRTIWRYNNVSEQPLPLILVCIPQVAALRTLTTSLASLQIQGAATGVFTLAGVVNPNREVLPYPLQGFFETRMVYHHDDEEVSRLLCGHEGAERLARGEFLYATKGQSSAKLVGWSYTNNDITSLIQDLRGPSLPLTEVEEAPRAPDPAPVIEPPVVPPTTTSASLNLRDIAAELRREFSESDEWEESPNVVREAPIEPTVETQPAWSLEEKAALDEPPPRWQTDHPEQHSEWTDWEPEPAPIDTSPPTDVGPLSAQSAPPQNDDEFGDILIPPIKPPTTRAAAPEVSPAVPPQTVTDPPSKPTARPTSRKSGKARTDNAEAAPGEAIPMTELPQSYEAPPALPTNDVPHWLTDSPNADKSGPSLLDDLLAGRIPDSLSVSESASPEQPLEPPVTPRAANPKTKPPSVPAADEPIPDPPLAPKTDASVQAMNESVPPVEEIVAAWQDRQDGLWSVFEATLSASSVSVKLLLDRGVRHEYAVRWLPVLMDAGVIEASKKLSSPRPLRVLSKDRDSAALAIYRLLRERPVAS